MIRLPDTPLAPSTLTALARLQSRVNDCTDYAAQVAEAKRLWEQKSRTTFVPVRNTLRRMIGKSYRCAYCEDSEADEVEHIHPKTLYPERAFLWENYLFACGLCNPEKSDRFAVFPGEGEEWVDIRRPQGKAIVPPVAGEPLLINPRLEDPLEFLVLDIRGTFEFVSNPSRSLRDQERAKFTIEILGLNRRGLPRFRRSAYGDYRARLREYIHHRDQEHATSRELRRLVGAIKRLNHHTVWKEMKRQSPMVRELATLFYLAPEARGW